MRCSSDQGSPVYCHSCPTLLLFKGTRKPYTAPVYLTYREAFLGLANQGFLSFYKGNLLNLLHLTLGTNIKLNIFYLLDYSQYKTYKDSFYH